jgi:hypothetical protein
VRRLVVLLAALAAAVATTTSTAQAGLLPGLLPGLLSPAENPVCDTNVANPFAPWNDHANYVLMPGGSFESGSPSWKLPWGARIVSGNEHFYVRGAGDSRSLYVPRGATVQTPPMCFAFGDWKLRMFARSVSAPQAEIRVQVSVSGLLGLLSVLDAGRFTVTGEWQPSEEFGLLITNLGGLLTTDAVSFRFTPVGGSVVIDDAYLDPTFHY